MDNIAVWLVFGFSLVFAALSSFLKKFTPLWALLSALCCVAGLLLGLTAGLGLDALLCPVLLCLAAALAGKGGNEG